MYHIVGRSGYSTITECQLDGDTCSPVRPIAFAGIE